MARAVLLGDRPPSYLSKATLAAELDISESTVDEMVRRGILPQPVKLSSGCVRWCWAQVEASLGSMVGAGQQSNNDPFMAALNETAA